MKPLLTAALSIVLSLNLFGQAGPGQPSCITGASAGLGYLDNPVQCDGSPSCSGNGLSNSTCTTYTVNCLGIAPIDVCLRVTAPVGITEKGTVIMGAGGAGVGFYGSSMGGGFMVDMLVADGFRVVERSWSRGWWKDSGTGIRRQSCRYATVAQFIFDNEFPSSGSGGAFVATGNSAGSSEIGYALSTWGLESIFDRVVLSSGPVMSRMDLFCGVGPGSWPTDCAALLSNAVYTGATTCPGLIQCFYDDPTGAGQPLNSKLCKSCPTATAADRRKDSIMHIGADYTYPNTKVRILLGTDDCGFPSSAIPNALMYSEAVRLAGTETTCSFVNGDHDLYNYIDGGLAIVQAVVTP